MKLGPTPRVRPKLLIEPPLEHLDGSSNVGIVRIQRITATTGIRVAENLSGIHEAFAAVHQYRHATAALAPGR